MLLWLYYSAQIFLLGAEFTWVYAKARREATARRKPMQPAASAALPLEKPAPGESESQSASYAPSALRKLMPLIVAAGGFATGRLLGRSRFS